MNDNDQRELVEEILHCISDTIVLTDAEFRITFINRGVEKTFGYCQEELFGQNIDVLFATHRTSAHDGQEEDTKDHFLPETCISKNGCLFPVEIYNRPIFSANNQLRGSFTIIRDTSERVILQAELKKAKEKAEESDRLKSAFLANISHEIRTPLNAIVGFSDFLVHEETDRSVKEQFSKLIQSNSLQLLKLLEEIMDLAKIETGEIVLSKQPIDVGFCIESILSFYRSTILGRPIEVSVTSHIEEGVLFVTDQTRFCRIIDNLTNNAFKFTKQGKICIECKLVDDGDLFISVSDTGIGISEDLKPFIFNRFRQGAMDMRYKYSGTGLGLSLVKAIIEIFRGKIWFESELGKGSTFFVQIPSLQTKNR